MSQSELLPPSARYGAEVHGTTELTVSESRPIEDKIEAIGFALIKLAITAVAAGMILYILCWIVLTTLPPGR